MSRVVKGGRLFKPVAKPPATQKTTPATGQLPTPPATSKAADFTHSQPPPTAHAARPLFNPEPSPPAQQQDAHTQPTTSLATAAASAEVAVAVSKQPSAAEKMRLKAKAAKAARAAEKLRNPSAFRRSTSVLTDTSSISINRNPSIPATSPPPKLPPPTTSQDISVPDLDSTSPARPTQKAWSPPIDPLLDIATFIDDTVPPLLDHPPSRQDIPVPAALPSPTLTGPSPTLPDHQSQATGTQEKTQEPARRAGPSKSAKPPPKKKPANFIPDQSAAAAAEEEEEEEEDISPRLKRKRHLEQLRKSKKNKKNDSLTPSQNQENDDQMDKINQKVSARFKKRQEKKAAGSQVKKPRGSQQKQKKKKQVGEGVDENAGPEGEEGVEEGELSSDGPLDPTKVSMAELTRPERLKGQSSEVLAKRLELIVERREREKNERAVARQEAKQEARLRLFNRAQSVKARRKQREDGQLDGDEQEEEDFSQQQLSPAQPQDDGQPSQAPDGALEQQQADDTETQAESRKRKIMEEYGLEDLDSDDDLADFEEVDYDEFAKGSKKNPATAPPAKKTAATPAAADEEEDDDDDENMVVEEFNVDDYVPQASQYAPQLRVVDGQMVLDQDSLAVDRRDHTPPLDDMEVVEESDATRLVNSNTWSKAVRGERWSADETSLFYDAVRLFGSDFEMISQLFPGRTRRQIRLKWNKEEKINGAEITAALLGKKRSSTGAEDDELSRISEHSEGPEAEREEGGSGMGEEVEGVDDLVIPTQLTGFSEYARIVGIDCSGPIPLDPMDKWREKERLEFAQAHPAADKAKKADADPARRAVLDVEGDEDEDEGELVEEDFGGWGELDDL
ncbi:hypothetical protein PTTG_02515 [Puccinia triticina 1-1 BBBD Race 1]|uniref:HTH myb-type domain-containing protein n=1 Tax=Puccinia triticina (isolate 1-1 / race 1 (BBBD)) TaxID=630390 RepID=A0A180GJL1_PUCT1|nr:hypothetical protein PTTG_02515 [Puccinia triticina 1-1 BBBD Race 1]